MAAQISKQQARDTVSVRQRQQVEARDAAARRQIERAAMSVDTRYSPSPSPRHALQPADVYLARRPCRSLHLSEHEVNIIISTRQDACVSCRHHGRSRSRSYSPQRYRRSRSRSRSRSPRRPDQYAPHSPRPSPGGLHLPLIMSNAIDACSCCRCSNLSSCLWNTPWRRWLLVLLVPACHTCDKCALELWCRALAQAEGLIRCQASAVKLPHPCLHV